MRELYSCAGMCKGICYGLQRFTVLSLENIAVCYVHVHTVCTLIVTVKCNCFGQQ